MSVSEFQSIQDIAQGAHAFANTADVAASAPVDNVEIVGRAIDRTSYKYAQSVVLLVSFKAVLAAGKTLTLKNVAIEHCDLSTFVGGADLVTFSDYVLTDSGSGSTTYDCRAYKANLSGAKRYIRVTLTPDLNASGTDTADLAGIFVFGSGNQYGNVAATSLGATPG